MKRLFIILTCALLACTNMHAQFDEFRKPVKFGFDLGLGYANQWGNAYDPYGKSGLLSFCFGVDLDINFAKRSFVEIGIDFARKGCKIEGNEWIDKDSQGGPWKLLDNEKTTANLFYLEIPVMYGLELPIEQEVAWKFMVGPYFAAGLCGDRISEFKQTYEDRLATISSFTKDPTDYSYRKFDVGAKIQTGIEIRRVSYMIAYELGLFNTLKESKNFDYGYKARNNNIMMMVSFRF